MIATRLGQMFVLAGLMVGIGCNSSAPASPASREPAVKAPPTGSGSVPNPPPPPPSPPSGGACGCTNDDQCIAEADAAVKRLREPATLPPERHYVGAECVKRDEGDPFRCCFARPAVCLCYYAWTPANERAFQNALVLGNRTTCDVTGRSPDCLYQSCEFPGCDPSNPSSCDRACADADARLRADAARTFDAERRTARCRSCYCQTVYRVGNRCYARPDFFARSYDCTLGDEAILAAENAPPVHQPEATPRPPDPAPGCNGPDGGPPARHF